LGRSYFFYKIETHGLVIVSTPQDYKMTATLWIHRSFAADILVRFSSGYEAHQFGARLLLKYQGLNQDETRILPWNEILYKSYGIFDVGSTSSLQISVHPNDFHPKGYLGVCVWNPDGTVLSSPEDALNLGIIGIPEGFVPKEDPEGLWEKRSITAEELDLETQYNRFNREYAKAVEEAKTKRLATSAFGYDERLDGPMYWPGLFKPILRDSNVDLSDLQEQAMEN